jgi:putative transposase
MMPRQPRVAPGEQVYHVINRANGRLRLFRTDDDFLAFYRAMAQAHARTPLRLLAWCIMGNHWHFVAWPREDGELSRFFGYLALTHATRWQAARGVAGTGHVYQARFKNFLIQRDAHLAWVIRYVERNPLRAGLVRRAQDWRWSSLHARLDAHDAARALLSPCPIDMPAPRAWATQVNRPQSAAEEQAVQSSVRRSRPLGDDPWLHAVVRRYHLQSTMRARGGQPGRGPRRPHGQSGTAD